MQRSFFNTKFTALPYVKAMWLRYFAIHIVHSLLWISTLTKCSWFETHTCLTMQTLAFVLLIFSFLNAFLTKIFPIFFYFFSIKNPEFQTIKYQILYVNRLLSTYYIDNYLESFFSSIKNI